MPKSSRFAKKTSQVHGFSKRKSKEDPVFTDLPKKSPKKIKLEIPTDHETQRTLILNCLKGAVLAFPSTSVGNQISIRGIVDGAHVWTASVNFRNRAYLQPMKNPGDLVKCTKFLGAAGTLAFKFSHQITLKSPDQWASDAWVCKVVFEGLRSWLIWLFSRYSSRLDTNTSHVTWSEEHNHITWLAAECSAYNVLFAYFGKRSIKYVPLLVGDDLCFKHLHQTSSVA